MEKLKTYICEKCGVKFHPPTNTRKKFCSRKCSALVHAKQRLVTFKKWRIENNGGHPANWKGVQLRCETCGGEKFGRYAKKCLKCFLGYKGKSGLESRVEDIINKYKLPYKFVGDGKFRIENKYPDFVNTNGEKKVVEVYWKVHKDKFRKGGCKEWMKTRKDIFGKYGWKTIFIEGSKINENKVLNYLKGGNNY